ncbi:hypothetical protein TNCV_3432231 [Trichonephila clavipes]|nr:hypothetical protein TNCV_3432231 [Trichonephila clavipes]
MRTIHLSSGAVVQKGNHDNEIAVSLTCADGVCLYSTVKLQQPKIRLRTTYLVCAQFGQLSAVELTRSLKLKVESVETQTPHVDSKLRPVELLPGKITRSLEKFSNSLRKCGKENKVNSFQCPIDTDRRFSAKPVKYLFIDSCYCYQCHLIGKGQIKAHEIHHGKVLSDTCR